MADNNGTDKIEPTGNGAIGAVRNADLIEEMQTAYLDYAMSVIVARALPDVRDGLKPVHRRILYAMWNDLSLTHDKPHKKSARIVGEVLGKYHPHGDTAVYDAMVRMAQDFSLRYPLIDGQGNFGSIDGDNAAAMRYTEARLARITNLMLDDLDKDTVGWHSNFDNSLREPDVLPAALPNLLINGSSGIAVGMATNIPPHNLGEVVDALVYLIDHFDKVDDIALEALTHFIKGPDFPTGGIVYRYREEGKGEEDADAIAQGYSMGKSRLIVQAKAHFEEISRGRTRIIITELPYQTNKTALIERIADLVRDGKIEGISDLRDESDRTGMRIVIELTRNVEPKDILADLFKYTPLQQTFGMQLLALVDGQPRLLNLKRLLQLFVQHRQEIIRRRSEFDLKRARERAHIVEGLLRALDILDEVIHTIRHSQTVDTARKNLVAKFDFSEIQAQAILDMQLRRLAALERKRLQEEYDDLKKRIAYLEDLLAHPHKILDVIKTELLAIREQYADARRTQIVDRTRGALTTHDLLPDQTVWVTLGKGGELRRQGVVKVAPSVLRQIGRDSQTALLTANTRDLLYVFCKDGRCSRIGIHEIPDDGGSKGVSELTGFQKRDEITSALVLPRERIEEGEHFVFLCTERGAVKRVTVEDLQTNTNPEFPVINLEKGDRLLFAVATRGGQEVILVSADGQSIRFGEEEVRSMGLAAGGVGGIKLRAKDRIIFAAVVDPEGELLTATTAGFVKRTALSEFSPQGRNGGGIVAHKLSEKTGKLAAGLLVPASALRDALIFVMSKGAAKPGSVAEAPVMGRAVLGKALIETSDKEGLAAVWRIAVTGSTNEPDEPAPAPKGPSRTRVPAEQVELLNAAPTAPALTIPDIPPKKLRIPDAPPPAANKTAPARESKTAGATSLPPAKATPAEPVKTVATQTNTPGKTAPAPTPPARARAEKEPAGPPPVAPATPAKPRQAPVAAASPSTKKGTAPIPSLVPKAMSEAGSTPAATKPGVEKQPPPPPVAETKPKETPQRDGKAVPVTAPFDFGEEEDVAPPPNPKKLEAVASVTKSQAGAAKKKGK